MLFPEPNEPSRVEVRQRFEHHAVHDTKHRGRRSDAERERHQNGETAFARFADGYVSEWTPRAEPNVLREIASDLQTIGGAFGVDTAVNRRRLLKRASELESQRAKAEPDVYYEGVWSNEPDVEDVASMFGGLQRELQERWKGYSSQRFQAFELNARQGGRPRDPTDGSRTDAAQNRARTLLPQ